MYKKIDIVTDTEIIEYNGRKYDCKFAVKRDKELIIQEAELSHKEDFERLYDKESLSIDSARFYVDSDDKPIIIMLIYVIKYKEGKSGRYACGDYYPIIDVITNKECDVIVHPHPFQASICW